MQQFFSPNRGLSTLVILITWHLCPGTTWADDSYDPTTHELTIPTLQVGAATYSNVVVTIGSAGLTANRSFAVGSSDTYNPLYQQLVVPEVFVSGQTAPYYNVIATVQTLNTVASVSGADSYEATSRELSLPMVAVGGSVYTNVVITVSGIVSRGGGMPQNLLDVYDPIRNQLTMQAIRVGDTVYTNPVITPGAILSIGGRLPGESLLHSFAGSLPGSTDGNFPAAGLILASDGNFYGTSVEGGNGLGTVFRITPAGTESILHAFSKSPNFPISATDGAQPEAPLVEDSAGNLYGTTMAGGPFGAGTVFRITPGGTESLVFAFGATPIDAAVPVAGLLPDAAGNLYGTTFQGGTSGLGTVFRIDPAGRETVLHSFTGGADGASPQGGLAVGADGNYYGTTSEGGLYGGGAAFRMTPGGVFTRLYSFGSATGDGLGPGATLVLGPDGNFYGTTFEGGQYGAGTVFRISPDGSESLVYSFSGGGLPGSNDGANPASGVIVGSDGNLYGTTLGGGAYGGGTVYRVSPAPQGAQEIVLYSFSGSPGFLGSQDGASPQGNLLEGTDGSFYGTAPFGGADNGGAVFKLTSVLGAHQP